MLFNQVEFLPVAYFTVLMWVVSANLIARLFGPVLLKATSGSLHSLLSRELNVGVTADELKFHVFESRVLSTLKIQLLFNLARDFARLLGEAMLPPCPVSARVLQNILVPRQYRSGCPPPGLS